MSAGFTALVLAGSRGGVDPVAAYAGVAHKALIPVGGVPMVARVIQALREAGAGRIAVSTDAPEVIAIVEAAGAEPIAPAAQPSASVAAALAALGTPLLVTTADHALLRPEWVRHFLADVPAEADVAILLAERALVEAAAPGTRRTWYRFADGAWSGCNLFHLATPRAAAALALWQRVETHRKRPWRLAGMIGLGTLLRYALGRLTIAAAVARIGASVGIRAAMVPSRHGLAALDVDKPADLDLARALDP
ncbi:MAG: NTP transferase domain-containing protein [Alphaproteobacteria bacterium]|nr:NTP transferase domain-containing protein [Alphaproteobacteria bacterium]